MSLDRPLQNAIIDFIEAYHTTNGEFPGRSVIIRAIKIADPEANYDPGELDALLEDDNFIKSLNERGIVPPWKMATSPVGLTTEQLAAVAVLNNPKDRRSDQKKLADLGISMRKYSGWCHDKRFSNYMKISANALLENMEAEAHMGLIRSLGNNNTQAQKLYFEMTGRWNPAYESSVNVQVLMTRFVEIIQKHVHDPQVLQGIAADLQLAAVETGAVNQQRTIAGSAPKAISSPVGSFEEPKRDLGF